MSHAVETHGLAKRYWKLDEPPTLLRSVLPFNRPTKTELWALRDVNLTVERGESVGIIGRNGSGKTTLLKILCGITSPTQGQMRVVGRTAPLVSVGVGFQQEMTGRENVLLNGMLLGLTREEVKSRFDEIVDFAELWNFIDTPVKFYSSGMFVRLGFAVAVNTSPDILLVDEVLSVGDLPFQLKCAERITSLQEHGATIVLVSHAIGTISAITTRVVLLDKGVVKVDGDVAEGIDMYHQLVSEDESEDVERVLSEGEKFFVGGATVTSQRLLGSDGRPTHYAQTDDHLRLEATVRFENDIESPMFYVQVIGPGGQVVYGKHSRVGFQYRGFRAGQDVVMTCDFEPRVSGGSYKVLCWVVASDGRRVLAAGERGESFFVEPLDGASGAADLRGKVLIDGVHVDALARESDAAKGRPDDREAGDVSALRR